MYYMYYVVYLCIYYYFYTITLTSYLIFSLRLIVIHIDLTLPSDVSKEDWALIVKMKKVFNIS